MTIGLIFTLLLVALNKKIACVEKGLEMGGCTLRETREGLGTWPSPPALGKCAEEDKYIYIYLSSSASAHFPSIYLTIIL